VKIGILTYHRLVNRGSVLQAYALQKLLSSKLPRAQVEIVDYSSRKMELLSGWRFVRNRWPIPFDFHELAELRRMRRFGRRHLVVSGRKLRTDSTRRTMSWLAESGYDAVVVGSDVVWEVQPRRYSIGGITPYHLPGATPFTKASFAVSMDPVVDYPSRIRPRLREMADHVSAFDFISIRDEATRGVLLEHGVAPERIHYMPDPTLLVDIGELVAEASPVKRADRPVLAVDLPPALARRAHLAGRLLDWEVWDWRHLRGPAVDRPLPLGMDIGQVLAAYREVDVLVTDRFHGSILASCIGGAGVVFLEHLRKWPAANSKGRDLFQRAGAEGLVCRAEAEGPTPRLLAEHVRLAGHSAAELRAGLERVGRNAGASSMDRLTDLLLARSAA